MKRGFLAALRVLSMLAAGFPGSIVANGGDTETAPDALWEAISGLTGSTYHARFLFAVPNDALPSAIYRVALDRTDAPVVTTLAPVTFAGEQVAYDLEGIARDTSIAGSGALGFWLAVEGDATGGDNARPNRLVQTDSHGRVLQEVLLPETYPASAGGFSGVAVSDDGRYLLAPLRAPLAGDATINWRSHTRIARYDLETGDWDAFLYPLEHADVPGGEVTLTEITSAGGGRYVVVERDDTGTGQLAAFTLDDVEPWDGPVTASDDLTGHVIDKQPLLDLDSAGTEAATVTASGTFWVAGEVNGRPVAALGSLPGLLRAAAERHEHFVDIQLLAINDLHGRITTGQYLNDRPVGGAAYMAAYLDLLESDNPDNTLRVHAGDAIGGSPPESALLQDEPTVTILNELGFDLGVVGNHEFDDGIDELLRVLHGGCHPVTEPLTGCFGGANFPTLAANVVWSDTGETILPPTMTFTVDGVEVGFIGVVTTETPSIVRQSAVERLTFLDEAAVINQYADALVADGVETIIVLIHNGGWFEGDEFTGPIIEIVEAVSDEVDVLINGHTNGGYALMMDSKLVTQARQYSMAVADIDLTVDRRTGDVVEKSARIIDTYNDLIEPDARIAAMVDDYVELAGPLLTRSVGTAAHDITRTPSESGETALGNLIADAQRWKMGTDFAVMNPGGMRSDILAGEILWRDLFAVHPFGNDMLTMDLTGAQLYTLLNQQWQGERTRILQISGFEYDYDPTRPLGDRVVEIRQVLPDGQRVVVPNDGTRYSLAVNSYLGTGGDNFTIFDEVETPVVGPPELDALVDYVEQHQQPVSAEIEGRIRVES